MLGLRLRTKLQPVSPVGPFFPRIFFSLLLGFVISYFLLLRFKRTQKTQTREDRRERYGTNLGCRKTRSGSVFFFQAMRNQVVHTPIWGEGPAVVRGCFQRVKIPGHAPHGRETARMPCSLTFSLSRTLGRVANLITTFTSGSRNQWSFHESRTEGVTPAACLTAIPFNVDCPQKAD